MSTSPSQEAAAPAPPCVAVTSDDATTWFKREVHTHEPLLRNYLRGTFRDVDDVEDVVQESFLRVWKANATKRVEQGKAFLFQVARHLALDVLRRKQVSPILGVGDSVTLFVLDEKPSPDECTCRREEIELIAEAIHSLPPRCREVMILRKLKSVPQKEVAAQLGITEKTVMAQVWKGLQLVRAYLSARGVRCQWRNDPTDEA